MKNVLLLCLSTIKNARVFEYSFEVTPGKYETVTGCMTNEAPAKAEKRNVDHPLDKKFAITINGEPSEKDGITRIEKDGNYEWVVQDWQIEELLGLGAEERFKRKACNMIAKGEILCLATYEAGKIVYIKKTEEQKKVLLEAAMNPECDRRELLFSLKRPKVYDTME